MANLFRAALIACASGAALVPLPSAGVERWYAARLYAALQPLLTSLSNLAPFALLDPLIGVIAVLWIAFAARDLRRARGRARGALLIVVRTIVW